MSFGGGTRIRTGDQGFADPRLTTWLCRHTHMIARITYYNKLFFKKSAKFIKKFQKTDLEAN